jgi:signal transduction histidine kinase
MQQRSPEEAASVKNVLAIADEASRDVRGIAHQMMPRALGDLGLVPAMNDMLQRSLVKPGLHHSFEHFGIDARLPADVEVGVYRIAQELVTNILKHADARTVNVQLLKNKGHLVLIVEDDGNGIGNGNGAGIGLLSMHDRARAMHGHIEFMKGPVRGTVATLRIPLNQSLS